jgi:hypothetical protein
MLCASIMYLFILIVLGVITFSPHELPACVILPPRTTTSTKKEHQTTIFTYFVPFRQSNSCKNLNALTQFKKWPKYPRLKKKKKLKENGVAAATLKVARWLAAHLALRGCCMASPEPGGGRTPRPFLEWPRSHPRGREWPASHP